MSHWNGWTVEKAARSPMPGVVSSPSEIAGKLNFSYAKTPPPGAVRRSYGDVDSCLSVNSRLRDYHMSRQDPAVLDQLYKPSPSSPGVRNGYLYNSPLSLVNHVSPGNGLGMAAMASRYSRNVRTPLPTSLLRQTLTSRHQSPVPGRSSLVNRAAQRGVHPGSRKFSPVIVRLSGPASSNSNERREEMTGDTHGRESAADPCDKDTVISALRKKRKRWAASNGEDDSEASSVSPSAKRSRPNGTADSSVVHVHSQPRGLERKRLNESPAVPQTAKRARIPSIHTPRPTSSHRQTVVSRPRVVIPDIEYESDRDSEQDEATARPEPLNRSVGDRKSGSMGSSRSSTPSVSEDEEESKRKREELARLERSLTTVFPSSLTRTSSQRRKVPIFCATGSKPHMPARPSSCSATQEDIQRDREVAAARLRDFLMAEDAEDVKTKSEGEVPAASAQSTASAPHPPSSSSATSSKPSFTFPPPAARSPSAAKIASGDAAPHQEKPVTKDGNEAVSASKTESAPAAKVAAVTDAGGLQAVPTVTASSSSSLTATTAASPTSAQTTLKTASPADKLSTTPVSATTTSSGKTSLAAGGLQLQGVGLSTGAIKSVSFSLTPSTVSSVVTTSAPALVISTQSGPPSLPTPASQATSNPASGGIVLGQGLKLGSLGGSLSLPTSSSTAPSLQSSLNFKLPSVPLTTPLPTSGLFGAPPTSSATSMFAKPMGISFGTTMSAQSTNMVQSSNESSQPSSDNTSTTTTQTPASTSQAKPSLVLGQTQPSLSLAAMQPSAGSQPSQAQCTAGPTMSTVSLTTGSSSQSGQSTFGGIFSQSQAALSTQSVITTNAGMLALPTQPITSVPNLTGGSAGLTINFGAAPIPSSQPSQSLSLGQTAATSQAPGLQGTGQTSQTSIFGTNKLATGIGGGLFQNATTQSQTFNFTGATSGQPGTNLGLSNGSNQSGLLSSMSNQSGLLSNTSNQSGLLGANQAPGTLGTASKDGVSVPTFSFTAGSNGSQQSQGLFGASASTSNLAFNFSAQKPSLGQPQAPGQSGASTGLTFPAPNATTGQNQSGVFNFSAGLAGAQGKPSINFTAGDKSSSGGSSSVFNFSAQTGSNTGLATQQTQPAGSLFKQSQAQGGSGLSGGLFNQTQTSTSGGIFNQTQKSTSGGLFNQTQTSASGGLFNNTQTSTSGGLFNQTQTSSSGGLFNQTQSSTTGRLFNQTQPQGSGGLFNQAQGTGGGMFGQTQAPGGLFNQPQAQSSSGMFNPSLPSGGLFNASQNTSGQAGAVFNFTGGVQNSSFPPSFQSPQQPQPQAKLSFTPTPLPNPSNPAAPSFAQSPSFNFSATGAAGKTDSPRGRPVARARRRHRK